MNGIMESLGEILVLAVALVAADRAVSWFTKKVRGR
jgi:hypothetical protein